MTKDQNNGFSFQQIFLDANLGEVIRPPEPVSGGLLHRMYAVKNEKGKYAVKRLNPEILKRPEALINYMNSEKIANLLSARIPALPAKIIDGQSIKGNNNQFYMIFDWVEGKCLKPSEISSVHSEKIGSILADLHKTNVEILDTLHVDTNITHRKDWDFYLKEALMNDASWAGVLKESIAKLYEWEAKAKAAAKILSSKMVISHRDLDPKNVMWNHGRPILIDWESAGSINPMQDLIETALYWSDYGRENINKQRFFALVEGYKKNYGKIQADWIRVVENGYTGKLDWLNTELSV